MSEGIGCYRILFPKGMDANEYALQVKPAEKSLDLVIRKAQWLGKGNGPKVSTQAVSNEAAGQATKEEKDNDIERRVAVNPPPCPVDEERPGINPVPTRQDESTASPLPSSPVSQVNAEEKDGEVIIRFGDRRWRIRGLEKNLSYSLLKVNLLVSREIRDAFHVDTFDLYASRQRQVFIKQAADELCVKEDVIKKDLGKVLLELESLQDRQKKR